MSFREILNSSLHAHVHSLTFKRLGFYTTFFLKCQNFFFNLLNLQLNGEAYNSETAVKQYLNSFEIKA